jgi:nucleotide-binding universal stress UspA family protein
MPAAVIAAVDPAAPDLAPARFAAAVAGWTGAPLHVAGVYADDETVGRLAGGQLGEELRSGAGDVLDEVVAELGGEGAASALSLAAASAPRALELAAQELGCALVVVGSAAGTADGRTGPGSVGRRVLEGFPCAVAIVPAGHEALTSPAAIGAGAVDTAEGRAAVAAAQVLAGRSGAALRIVAAVRARGWMDGDPEALEAQLRDAAAQAASRARGQVLGQPVDTDVDAGEPADVLLAAAAELDLLVCGARGYGPRPATLLGGVTGRLVTEAPCPVMVLARGPLAGIGDLVA